MKTTVLLMIVCLSLRAQPSGVPEPLTAWPYYKEVSVIQNTGGLRDFVLDSDTLDKARENLADLRLYDARGREIPYVLRIRRAVSTSDARDVREFNRGVERGAAQVSFDLGERVDQHNEVQIDSAGSNFRRLVEVQGSADGEQWSTLVPRAILFRFTANGSTVEQTAIPYPMSRYRYVRVRVAPDEQVDAAAPIIKSVRIRRTIERKAETVPFRATFEARDADRAAGRPASVWRAEFGGRIPIEGVEFTIPEGTFARPFQIDGIDDPTHPIAFASGVLERREGAAGNQMTVKFAEQYARRIRLTVTDDRNAPLQILSISALSAARQVIFEASAAGAGPLRLYFGNPKALAAHYDLETRVPEVPSPAPVRTALGPQRDNPVYQPEAKPLTERLPWLVYLVLSVACLVLAGILLNLARVARQQVPI